MKKVIVLLCSAMLSASAVFADHCFIAKKNGKVLQTKGDPEQRYAPQSTFKIPLALMGFDSGILTDATHPVWPFQPGYVDYREAWKQDMNPTTWIKESCVWYSQVLTKQLGMEKFQNYVTQFDYGNMDVSGDSGQNNGLSQSWLSSSLGISSTEQIAFLQNMLAGKFSVKPEAYAKTKQILFVQDLKNGWTLYGKTGTGSLINQDGTKNPDLYHGWFVGWIEKDDQYIVFSNHLEDDKKEDVGAGQRARADAINRLSTIISHIDAGSQEEQKEAEGADQKLGTQERLHTQTRSR
jgi:beta-lactamase class D OXA-29